MPTFDFQVVLNGIQEMDEQTAETLYSAGCDDGTPFSRDGFAAVGFSRDAATLEDAIRSAISDVNRAGFTVAHVEPADESVYVKINQELTQH